MPIPKILLQFDTDAQPSVFDAIVAIDAGVDQLLRHHSVTPENVRELVYGAMFTRSPAELQNTAIFIGGADVAAAEKLLAKVTSTFFGPVRVSMMFDPNGANTTAAAAVLSAMKHIALNGAMALVLGGTGPVGQRVARLLARSGAHVRVGSRKLDRANEVCAALAKCLPAAEFMPVATDSPAELRSALDGAAVVIAAGAPGALLLPADARRSAKSLRVAIDLNAVPPLGIDEVDATDKAVERDKVITYGAIGVGGSKMKIHKAALRKLFESNTLVLDAEEIFEIGRETTK